MQHEAPDKRREPDSLAPFQLEGASVDEEIARMKSGKGVKLALTLVLTGVAVAAGVRILGRVDASQAYAHAADRIEQIDAEQGEAFLRCVLPNIQPSQLMSAPALHTAIEIATERLDKAYSRQLAQCSPLLTEFQSALNRVRAPADMTRRLEGLRSAAGEFSHAWQVYRAYLRDPARHYDYVQAMPMIEKITLAWDAYRQQRDDTKAALRARD